MRSRNRVMRDVEVAPLGAPDGQRAMGGQLYLDARPFPQCDQASTGRPGWQAARRLGLLDGKLAPHVLPVSDAMTSSAMTQKRPRRNTLGPPFSTPAPTRTLTFCSALRGERKKYPAN